MNATSRFAALCFICVASASVGVGVGFRGYQRPGVMIEPRDVTIEPRAITVLRDVNEYDVVHVNFQIRNIGSSELVVESVLPTCGCTKVLVAGNQPLLAPIPIAPGNAIACEARIDTAGRLGRSQVGVNAVGSIGSKKVSASTIIEMNVISSWQATPSEVTLQYVQPGATERVSVALSDSKSPAGIKVRDVVASAPELIKASIRPASTGLDDNEPFAPRRLRSYVEIFVKIPPSEGTAQRCESLLIRPEDRSIPSLNIPICWSYAPEPYVLRPPTLFMRGESLPNDGRRRVQCQVGPTGTPDLVVASAPGSAKIKIIPQSSSLLTIDIDLSACSLMSIGSSAAVTLSRRDTGESVVSLPITVLK